MLPAPLIVRGGASGCAAHRTVSLTIRRHRGDGVRRVLVYLGTRRVASANARRLSRPLTLRAPATAFRLRVVIYELRHGRRRVVRRSAAYGACHA